MAVIIKPRSLGIMTKVERTPPSASLVVSAYGLFRLAAPDRLRFESEQALWLMTAKEVPPGAIFDIGMPKPAAEILIGGHAAAPGGVPTQRMGLSWTVGGLGKSLLVTGDRSWRLANATVVATEPTPFVQMPLTRARCFGGEDHPLNIEGTGFKARERIMARKAVALPNIEVPEQAIRSFTDSPEPARFGPMPIDAKERLRHTGTYDAAWLKTRAPALAADADPRLFLFAPDDQRWPGYLAGGEHYHLQNFCADAPSIEGVLPDFRVRCFVGWTDREKPVAEVSLRIDTLWLFAGAGRGVLIYRGALPIDDFEAADVADIMLAYEGADEDLPVAHHLTTRALRTDPERAYRYAFAEHQLTPARPKAMCDARQAARQARSLERQAKRTADSLWLQRKMWLQSGLPEELWPPPWEAAPAAEDLPLPLPEEIETGEVDLGELLDALEAIQDKTEAEFDAAIARQAPLQAVVAKFGSGEADTNDIDHLFDVLGQPDVPAALDAALTKLPEASSLPAEAGAVAKDLEGLAALKDWRGAMQAGPPVVDEAEQLAKARARFLGLPEGSPLSELRKQLNLPNLTWPEIGELPGLDRPPGEPPDIEAHFAQAIELMEQSDEIAASSAESVKEGVDEIDGALRKAFPNLHAPAGGRLSVIAALQRLSPPVEVQPQTPAEALALAKSTLASVPSQIETAIDAAESALSEAVVALRRMSPAPTAPDLPLSPAVARSFASLILAEARAGLSLAGRDLAGADLAHADLSGLDFSGAMLEGARLDGARLIGANLSGATLCGGSLLRADLSGCNLTETNLAKAVATGTRFDRARLSDANLLDAAFSEASFDDADLHDLTALTVPFDGASFRRARLARCVFMRSPLARSNWTGADVEQVQITDADCAGITLASASLRDVAFVKVEAVGADFQDAQFTNVAFAGETNLEGARFDRLVAERLSFQKASLKSANFERGRMDGVCFVETDLSRANLRAASLKRALLARNDLRGADLTVANLFEAQFNRADLRNARLWGANLYGADLADARLTGADLTRANLAGTVLAVPSDG